MFRALRRFAVIFATLSIVTGCTTMSPQDFASTTPALSLEEYFVGKTKAYGLFHDRFGTLQRRFTVDITGTLNNEGALVLDERFSYADGETQQRVWTIRKAGDGLYEGRADDVVGTARGELAGAVLRWTYDLDLPISGRTWQVAFDDWMILMDDGILMNKATVSKWGLKIGEVTLVFRQVKG